MSTDDCENIETVVLHLGGIDCWFIRSAGPYGLIKMLPSLYTVGIREVLYFRLFNENNVIQVMKDGVLILKVHRK